MLLLHNHTNGRPHSVSNVCVESELFSCPCPEEPKLGKDTLSLIAFVCFERSSKTLHQITTDVMDRCARNFATPKIASRTLICKERGAIDAIPNSFSQPTNQIAWSWEKSGASSSRATASPKWLTLFIWGTHLERGGGEGLIEVDEARKWSRKFASGVRD